MLFRSKTSWLGQEAVVGFFDTDAKETVQIVPKKDALLTQNIGAGGTGYLVLVVPLTLWKKKRPGCFPR